MVAMDGRAPGNDGNGVDKACDNAEVTGVDTT